jgi:hypothetical protein
MNTVQQLIDQLNTIEDKTQAYIGEVWIAEDFSYLLEEDYTSEQLAEVSRYRSIGKSIGYLQDEISEFLSSLKDNQKE